MPPKNRIPPDVAELRRSAEARLKQQQAHPHPPRTEADIKRFLHELQVHQIELELQNVELQDARDKAESLLETYADLYDFAPVGYFSVDEEGLILEVNLTGAALLGIERSRLINRRLRDFVDPHSRAAFLVFLKKIFAGPRKQICEIPLLNERSIPFWADLQGASASSQRGNRRWCRLAVSDVTTLKQAEQVRQNLEGMAASNRELKREIVQRQKAEQDLKKSEAHYAQLFEQARHMQEQLRHLSRQLLLTQENERKRISRELHDEIVQTLVGINVHLASLKVKSPVNLKDLRKRIVRTRRLVEKSVEIVHRFARELRPTVLDDLGLIPALQSFVKDFTKRTQIRIRFTAASEVEQLNSLQRTVLYRVAQSALANVEKHAHASEAKVSIRKLQGAIRLEIHDNGKSFDVERVLFAQRHKRLGLLGSRERVEMVGGKFDVKSAPGQGTTVSAKIPINEAGSNIAAKTSRKSARVG
ncbi:MAG: histidine kinase [Methylacidiphilales bacterium]|nr:histidine kinase [Candidatus Methylacidiphilales bacterium]